MRYPILLTAIAAIAMAVPDAMAAPDPNTDGFLGRVDLKELHLRSESGSERLRIQFYSTRHIRMTKVSVSVPGLGQEMVVSNIKTDFFVQSIKGRRVLVAPGFDGTVAFEFRGSDIFLDGKFENGSTKFDLTGTWTSGTASPSNPPNFKERMRDDILNGAGVGRRPAVEEHVESEPEGGFNFFGSRIAVGRIPTWPFALLAAIAFGLVVRFIIRKPTS